MKSVLTYAGGSVRFAAGREITSLNLFSRYIVDEEEKGSA